MTEPIVRDEWDAILAELCAGFDRPLTRERRDAYRSSLGKMGVIAWRRLVDYCLGPRGPEHFPTCRQLWQFNRELRRASAGPGALAGGPSDRDGWSKWAIAANRILLKLAYCDERRGFRPMGAACKTALAVKAEIVALAEEAEKAGDPWSNDEFVDICRAKLEKVLTPGCEDPEAYVATRDETPPVDLEAFLDDPKPSSCATER